MGWLAIDSAQSLIDAFDGDSVYANFLNHLPHTLFGMLAGLCIHIAYSKLQWHKQHPMRLIPKNCLIAIVFACVDTLINRFDLVLTLAQSCAPEYPKMPNFYCGRVASYFTHNVCAMLAWAMLYCLIQAERNGLELPRLHLKELIKAALALTATIQINKILNIIGWSSDNAYLFSKPYYLSEGIDFIITIILSAYVFTLNPATRIFGSRLLSWVPTLWVMAFCCATLSIGINALVWRLETLLTHADLSFANNAYYVLFDYKYGHWNSTGQLGGQLQGCFTYILLVSLFFIHYRFLPDWTNDLKNTGTFAIKKFALLWSYNTGFWLFFGTLIYATDLMGLAEAGKYVPLVSTGAFLLAGTFIGALLNSNIECLAAQKITAVPLGLKIFCTSLIAGAPLTSTLWLCNYTYIYVVLGVNKITEYSELASSPYYVLASIIVAFMCCSLWSLICYVSASQRLQHDATIKQLQLEMNMKEVQLNALAGKVDPHFVFNALNNIRTLVDEDSEKARAALVGLSEILRSPITNASQDKIPVTEEMQLVRNYIALSKIQLEDLLTYTEEIEKDNETVLIPAMMLQIIVENAIKHGISQLPDGGILSLHICKYNQQLICKITNTGKLQLNSSTAGFGVGVNSIRQRLSLLYSDKASFSLQQINDTVIAELVLPFENSV